MNQPESPQYPYVRVADQVAAQIERGELLPGERVPSVHQLSETYGVSRSTARRALEVLKARGLTEALPGLGTFVKVRLDTKRPDHAGGFTWPGRSRE